MNRNWNMGDSVAAGALGAGLGGAYHLAKQQFYNTPEENEEENQSNALLKRIAVPGLVLGGANMVQNSVMPNYYNNAAAGHVNSIFSDKQYGR